MNSSIAMNARKGRDAALVAVWQESVVASHKAKLCAPSERDADYDVKNRGVSWVIERAPRDVRITDVRSLGHGIVGLAFRTQTWLHVPLTGLSAQACDIVRGLLEQGQIRAARVA